ncbi:FAD-binding protein [Streptomyces sp. NPDC059639]|uniref:FAD-binding protein n=1 Tax=Streptomyces sp. NPDC059639 TaxID=3346891 RepID=UPI00369F245E
MSSFGQQLATSVLVVGAGEAGLRAAIEVAEAGIAVMAVDRCARADGHSVTASGSFDDARAVTRYAGREFHVWEPASTGAYKSPDMHKTLRERAKQLSIPVLSHVYVTRLLIDDETVFGAYGFDLSDGSRYLLHADSVILAAGGHTRIWRRTSSHRHENTGDAFRLAVEAGARLRNPELVQFHPLGLISPQGAEGLLVSEAARSEGGILLNNLGERFMTRYDAERLERGSRNRVALASYTEIKEGRGTRDGGVWLDVSHLPRETVLTRLPLVHQTLLNLQMLDITHDPIEVAPTARCSIGGVRVRPEDHGTDVAGLYAVGDAASGLHGAHQLEENSPVELLVHSRIAGRAAAEYSAGLTAHRRSPAAVRSAEGDVNRLVVADGDQNVRALLRAVRHLMTEFAGAVRSETGLTAGLTALDEVESRMQFLGVHIDIGGFQELAFAYDLRSAVLAARATLECALERRQTQGWHHRSDHPDADSDVRVNLVWSPTGGVHRELVPPVPGEIAELLHDVSADTGRPRA